MSITTNIIIAAFGGSRQCKTRALYQWDYGQVLQFVGLELPTAYTVHFSNQPTGEAKTGIGDEDGVTIPDEYLTTGLPVYAWLYLHTGDSDGETRYTVEIPVKARSRPVDEPPTPQQQSVIDQLLSALESGIDRAETAAEHAEEAVESADGSAQAAAESAAAAAAAEGSVARNAQAAQTAQTGAEAAQTDAAGSATAAAQSAAQAASSAVEASAGLIYEDVSGDLVSFPDGANGARIKALTIGIGPAQSGSGDPSPDNVRPITGWTGASVIVSPTTDAEDGTTYPFSWETEAGTVYSGSVTLNPDGSADISCDRQYCVLDENSAISEYYAATSSSRMGVIFKNALPNNAPRVSQQTGTISNWAIRESDASNPRGKNVAYWSVRGKNSAARDVYLYGPYGVDVPETELLQMLADNPLQIVMPLATPQTIHIPAAYTPPILTLLGVNNIWADCGPIEALTYPADTKLYIDKIIAAQAALG